MNARAWLRVWLGWVAVAALWPVIKLLAIAGAALYRSFERAGRGL